MALDTRRILSSGDWNSGVKFPRERGDRPSISPRAVRVDHFTHKDTGLYPHDSRAVMSRLLAVRGGQFT